MHYYTVMMELPVTFKAIDMLQSLYECLHGDLILVLNSSNVDSLQCQVHLVFLIHVFRNYLLGLDNLLGSWSLGKIVSLSWQPLITCSSSPRGRALWHSINHIAISTSVTIIQVLCRQPRFWDFMSTASQSYIQDTIWKLVTSLSRSLNLSTPSSLIFPDPEM